MRAIVRFTLGLAVVVAVLRLTALRLWQVPEGDPALAASLAPTLWAGDWVLLWRGTPPSPGALVICPDPAEPDQLVAGRWVAGGGDLVEVRASGGLWLNNRKVPLEGSCPRSRFSMLDPSTGESLELACSQERLGRTLHPTASLVAAGTQPLGVKRKVPPDSWYLVSDNRFAPFDSRDFGALAPESCGETVRLRLASSQLPEGMGPAFRWIQ